MSLTRGGLSYLINTPDQLASFIQEAFKLKNGSRISRARAIGFAANVCAHFLPRGTCAVALPAVPRCTQRPRLINVAVPFHIVFGFPAEPPGRAMLLASRCVSPCSPVRMNAAVPWCDALGGHVGTSTDDIPQFCAWNRCRYARGGRPPSRGGATAVAIAQSVHHCKCARG